MCPSTVEANGDRSLVLRGVLVNARYRVKEALGRGRLATVYLGEEIATGREVSLKVFARELSADPEFASELARFAVMAARLTAHGTRIVGVQESSRTEDGRLFLVMDYVAGRSLGAILRDEGPLEVERALRIGRQIAEALEAAHRAGMLHGDIRPHHVLVTGTGDDETITLKGFEVATLLRTRVVQQGMRTGALADMPEYLAPEQIEGAATSAQTDVYRYGLLLYEMFTGFLPFTGTTPDEIRAKQLQDAVVPPRALRADMPPLLQIQVLQALEKSPERRPERVAAILNDEVQAMAMEEYRMEAAPAGRGVLHRLLGPIVESVERLESLRARWIVGGLALWLLASVAGMWLLVSPRPRMQPPSPSVLPAWTTPAAEMVPQTARDDDPSSIGARPSGALKAGDVPGSRPEATHVPTALDENRPVIQVPQKLPQHGTPPSATAKRSRAPRAVTARDDPAKRRPAGDAASASRSVPAPEPVPRRADGDQREAVPPDGTAIIDWLFGQPPR